MDGQNAFRLPTNVVVKTAIRMPVHHLLVSKLRIVGSSKFVTKGSALMKVKSILVSLVTNVLSGSFAI